MDRLVRRHGTRTRVLPGQRPGPGGHGPVRGPVPGLLRGILQRDLVAAVPRRHRPARIPPPVVGGLRDGQPVVRTGRGGPGGARRDGLGSRLPAPAGPADDPRAARRPAHRFLQPHPVPRLRDLRPASVAPPGRERPARRGPAGLPAPGRRHELPAGLPPGGGPGHARGPRSGSPTARSGRRRSRSRSTRTPWNRSPGGTASGSARPRSGRRWTNRPRSCWASTGSTTPRAFRFACAPTASYCGRTGSARAWSWCRWRARAGSG